MATKIQVSRGSLHARGVNDLLRGELFYVPANANNDKDKGFKDNPNFPWDEGTLYIGNPTLNPDGKPDAPIAIAGARAYKSLVYQGQLSKTVKDISDPAFTHVRTGDFFIFKEDPEEGRFFEEGFRSGDLLVITSAQYPIAPDIANGEPDTSSNIAYTRITGSAGEAKNVHYDDSKTNLNVNNVQDAIDNLANNKITYKGTIEGDFTLAAIMSSVDNGIGNTDYLESGSLYFVDKDGIPFYNNEKKQIKISKKGDFVLWDKEKGWTLIPSGLSDAKDIDFDPTEAVKQQHDLGTFTEDSLEHILSTGKLTDLQSAVTYLLSHKAMLDSDGKVPLSQLHGTVLGAMQYCGTWDPIFDAQGVNNPKFQKDWPTGESYERDDEEVSSLSNNHPGDYYIVKTSFTDIKYYDKTSAQLDDGTYVDSYILNNGDYIIYTVPRNENGDFLADEGHWEIIDNSATITSLNFNINGQHKGSEYDYLKDTKKYLL